MANDPDEERTQHWRGPLFGFGPVRDDEEVRLAVFAGTKAVGQELDSNSFDKNQLKKSNQSTAREAYVDWETFSYSIVGSRDLVGVSVCDALSIRQIRVDVNTRDNQAANLPALIVIDRVEKGDCAGHASLGFSKVFADANISDGERSKKRLLVIAELARRFSEVRHDEALSWPTKANVLLSRLRVVRLELPRIVRERLGLTLPEKPND